MPRTPKPKTEYQIICPNFATPGHRNHAYPGGKTKTAAAQKVKDQDHHYDMLAKRNDDDPNRNVWRHEIGWKARTREIGVWMDVE